MQEDNQTIPKDSWKNLLHWRQNLSKRYDAEENLVLSRRTLIYTNPLAPYIAKGIQQTLHWEACNN